MATEIRGFTQSSDALMRPALTPDVISADRETAYVLWATVHGQNAAEVARSLGIPEPTVRSWCQRDGWRARVEQDRAEQGQRVRSVVDAALLRIVPNVIERLGRIAMGQGDIKPVLTKDGEVVELEQVIPYQAQVNAARELVAIFNGPKTHHHHHTADATTLTPTTSVPTHDAHGPAPDPDGPMTRERAAALAPAERQAWEENYRRRQAG